MRHGDRPAVRARWTPIQPLTHPHLLSRQKAVATAAARNRYRYLCCLSTAQAPPAFIPSSQQMGGHQFPSSSWMCRAGGRYVYKPHTRVYVDRQTCWVHSRRHGQSSRTHKAGACKRHASATTGRSPIGRCGLQAQASSRGLVLKGGSTNNSRPQVDSSRVIPYYSYLHTQAEPRRGINHPQSQVAFRCRHAQPQGTSPRCSRRASTCGPSWRPHNLASNLSRIKTRRRGPWPGLVWSCLVLSRPLKDETSRKSKKKKEKKRK